MNTKLVSPSSIQSNTLYLGGLAVLLGIAIIFGSFVSFFFPVVLFLLLHFVYIPVEEREMEIVFGMQYIDYMRRVRRWLSEFQGQQNQSVQQLAGDDLVCAEICT